MISFKKDGDYLLPYDRQSLNEFLENSGESEGEWFGASFQLPGGYEGKDIGLDNYLKVYEGFFNAVVALLDDDGTNWIANHEIRDFEWFPCKGNSLERLRDLFKVNKVPVSFKGAIIFSTDDMRSYTKELISYPHEVIGKPHSFYRDLYISHEEIPVIIKISAHLNIDLLTTDIGILREIVNKFTITPFIVRNYRGTSL